ncbi:hypothetical protein BDA99DRAFT_568094 [Phascolomyces articulosus]|uniref:Uncharacterized protein n=1 Tax=Phascolomyces articulosus TaxID=60185 RepID=A0AAD5KQF1_9FUNG|nr:hypothetical protein BDA99DRAFT_568094 [Phascolomyces articulosus]
MTEEPEFLSLLVEDVRKLFILVIFEFFLEISFVFCLFFTCKEFLTKGLVFSVIRKLLKLDINLGFLEAPELLNLDENTASESFSLSYNYLLCIVEEKRGGGGSYERVHIGLVAIQPAIGGVTYDSFVDGYMRSKLEMYKLYINPCELLLPFV